MTNDPMPQREAFAAALAQFKAAACSLHEAWTGDVPGDAVIGYPRWMPSFDEAVADIVKMHPAPIRDGHSALAILRQPYPGNLSTDRLCIEFIGCADACRVDLDGEAWIWITEDLGGHEGAWQCCLYLGADHDGYYLPDAGPMGPEALRETVSALIVARDQAAAVFDALFGLSAGTGVSLVLKGGGVVTGTLQVDRSREITLNAGQYVTVAQDGRQTRTLALTDIRTAAVIG